MDEFPDFNERLTLTYRIAAIVGAAMIFSVFIYAGVIEILPVSGFKPFLGADRIESQVLRYTLMGIALVIYLVILFFRRRMASGKSTNTEHLQTHLQFLLSNTIIIFAFCESVAIYGLVLFTMTGRRADFYPFMVLSLIYFFINFPRLHQWEEWLGQPPVSPS